MTNEEKRRIRNEQEREELIRQADPEKYPWFMYQLFGYHIIRYLTEQEAKNTVQFYHLQKAGDKYVRSGKQGIILCRRERKT